MQEFLDLVLNNGVLGVVVGLFVLVGVFLLGKGGVVVTGDHKRIANVVLSILISFSAVDFSDGAGLVAAIASVASALVFTLIKAVGEKASG